MANLRLIGEASEVEFGYTDEGQVIARCVEHAGREDFMVGGCGWSEVYDDLNDATEYASDHADTGRR